MRAVGLRHHHQAGGILVQPVHDAGALHPADARKARAAMRDQRIDQRAGRVSGGRMHHQPLRLVDHDQGVVLVHDIERDVLGLLAPPARPAGSRRAIVVPGVDAVARIADRASVDRHRAGQDQRFEARAREFRVLREQTVEPLALRGGGDVKCGMPIGHELCQRQIRLFFGSDARRRQAGRPGDAAVRAARRSRSRS